MISASLNVKMATWATLTAELDAWSACGERATLWWRDDDAIAPSPSLDQLITLTSDAGVPLGLAIIPKMASIDLDHRVIAADSVWPMVHGYAHVNHAPTGEKKQELGDHRDPSLIKSDLTEGLRRIEKFVRHVAVLVPPWNRISDVVASCLANVGFVGLSTYGPRCDAPIKGQITIQNTHVDLIDWKGTRGFVGEQRALSQLQHHLYCRRIGSCDAAESTGILSHHLNHDLDVWRFAELMINRLSQHPAVRWLSPDALFTHRTAQ